MKPSTLERGKLLLLATAMVFSVAGCSLGGTQPQMPPMHPAAVRQTSSLGPIVKPKIAGTILGFDVDQHGDDGVFANCCGRTLQVSLETFDQRTGKITKLVGKGGEKTNYQVYGILADDVGFALHDGYQLMEPVTSGKLNGSWTAPAGLSVWQIAENQDTRKQAMLAINASDITSVIAADVARNTAKVIPLDQDEFSIGAGPVIAQDSKTNQAVVAGQNGGPYTHPVIGIVNLKSGQVTSFQGLGYGEVDGIGVDPKTDTACTTTGVDAGVEFYNLKTQTGFEVQLPNAASDPEIHSGAGVAVDSVNGLCVVAQPVSGQGTQASAIWIVDEKGNFLHEIEGFNFWFGVEPAINPGRRVGFIPNPRPDYGTLTGFSY